MNVVEIITNMHEGGIDNFPSTLNFLSFCTRFVMNGKSTTILKHIGMMEENELEVFVEVLDDKVGPSVVEDKAFTTPSADCVAPT
jgi:hypothetical protein